MKSDKDKEFDGFVQSKLKDMQSPDTFEEQWERMQVELDKKNSRRFYFFRFNIIYLLILVVSASVILWSLFLKEGKKSEKPEDGTGNTQELKIAPQEISGPEEKEMTPSRIDKNKTKSKEMKNTNNEESVSNLIKQEGEKDSVKPELVPVQPITISKPDSVVKPKVKKVKYVTKRDTIIQTDTTKSRRKR